MGKLEQTGGKSSRIAKNALLAHHTEADSLLINAPLGHYPFSCRSPRCCQTVVWGPLDVLNSQQALLNAQKIIDDVQGTVTAT